MLINESAWYALLITSLPFAKALGLAQRYSNTTDPPLPPFRNTTSNATAPSTSSNGTVNAFATLLIDTFSDPNTNALGFFHGLAGETAIGDFDETNPGNELKVNTGDIDASFSTSLAEGCIDFSSYQNQYIHIAYNGSAAFTVSLQQHNKDCDDSKQPFPETYDSVQASSGIAMENWFIKNQTIIFRIEMVAAAGVPDSFRSISKANTGNLWTACLNPNHIAFGIDDGEPQYLQRTLQIIKDERIPVTFFVQGSALQLPEDEANFTLAYKEMLAQGHQIGLHTQTHPHMESVKTQQDIDFEITENVRVVKEKLGVTTNYFRPPFGTIGARTRQALAKYLPNTQIIMWSIDVRDWVYGVDVAGDPQRLQYKAFADQLNSGGSIVVMHYLYKSTVDQFQDMIKLAKSKGRKFVRMDECIGQAGA